MKLLFLVYSVALLVFAWNSDSLLATDYIQSLSYPVIGTLVLYLLLHLPNFELSKNSKFLFFVAVVDFAFLTVILGWTVISQESLSKTILNSSIAVQAFMIVHSILLVIGGLVSLATKDKEEIKDDDCSIQEEDEYEEVIMRFETIDPSNNIFLLEESEKMFSRNKLISILNEIKEQFRVKDESIICESYKHLMINHFIPDTEDQFQSWPCDRMVVLSFDWRYTDQSKTTIEVLADIDASNYHDASGGHIRFTILVNPKTKKPVLAFIPIILE